MASNVERPREIVFRHAGGEVIAKNPMDLVIHDIGIHPDVVEQTFGEGSAQIYQEAMKSRRQTIQPEIQATKSRMVISDEILTRY